MGATLDQIEAALWTALAGLVVGYTVDASTAAQPELLGSGTPTGTQPFLTLHRYAGEVTRSRADDREWGLSTTLVGAFPSALLAFERELPLGQDGALVETTGHDVMVVTRSFWRVYVAVEDPRGDAQALASGVGGAPGILACVQRIKAALTDLRIAGLWEGGVMYLETLPWVIARRHGYVYAVRFAADAVLDATSETLPGAPMSRLDATLRAPSADTDGAAVTLSTSRATP